MGSPRFSAQERRPQSQVVLQLKNKKHTRSRSRSSHPGNHMYKWYKQYIQGTFTLFLSSMGKYNNTVLQTSVQECFVFESNRRYPH